MLPGERNMCGTACRWPRCGARRSRGARLAGWLVLLLCGWRPHEVPPSGAAPSGIPVAVLGVEARQLPEAVGERLARASERVVSRFGAFRLLPGQSLAELKLVFGCIDEQPACLARGGRQFGAAKLLWGAVVPHGGQWLVRLRWLDVASARVEQQVEWLIAPAADEAAAAQALAPALRTLLGLRFGTLVLRLPVAAARVWIDGRAAAASAAPVLVVRELSRGAHRVEVQKPGYVPWRRTVEVGAGETTELTVALALAPQPPSAALGPAAAGSRRGWRVAWWVTAAAAAGLALALVPNGLRVADLEQAKEAELERLAVDTSLGAEQRAALASAGCAAADRPAALGRLCRDGERHARIQNALIGSAAGLGVVALWLGYKAYLSRPSGDAAPPSGRQTDSAAAWSLSPSGGPRSLGLALHWRY